MTTPIPAGRSRVLLALTPAVLAALVGCDTATPPLPAAPPVAAKARAAALPLDDVLAVADALDAWLADGAARLPADPAVDANARGRTLDDYLPASHPLRRGAAGFTYAVRGGRGAAAVAVVTGQHDPAGPVARLTLGAAPAPTAAAGRIPWPLPPGWDTILGPAGRVDARFRQTCRDAGFLERGVQRFMADGFLMYPGHLFVDVNDAGRCVMDHVPGQDYLRNHFTGNRSEPAWRCRAEFPGNVCYDTVDRNGWNAGYLITARGYWPNDLLELLYVDPDIGTEGAVAP